MGLRPRGFDSRWGCVGAVSRGAAFREGLDRAVGERAGLGSRAAGCTRDGLKDLRFCVPSVDLPPSERSTGGISTAGGVRRVSASPFSWTVPREGRSAAHPDAKGTQDSSFARRRSNASALVTGSRRKRRSLGVSRTNADPCVPRDPQPECPTRRCCQPPGRGPFGDHTQRQPRQRTSKVTTPAAAHQHDETTCGSAPTTPRPPLIPTHAVRMLVRPVSELDHAPWEGETVEVPFTRLVVDD